MFKTKLTPLYFISKAAKAADAESFTNASLGLLNYWVRIFDYESRQYKERFTEAFNRYK